MKNRTAIPIAGLLLMFNIRPAHAQMAVVDVESVLQLQQQIQYWQQQIDGMTNQITTLRAQLASTTGSRGLGSLLQLTEAQRNYLPDTATALLAATTTDAGPSELRTAYANSVARQTALPVAMASRLSPVDRSAIEERRSAIATRSSAMQLALSTTSSRFSQLQSLIDQINKTTDPKGIQDLQGRIAAEQVMVLNEVAKLAAVTGWTESNIDAVRTHSAEAALASHGVFAKRLQPVIR